MTELLIECPVCEFKFQHAKSNPTSQATCPSCQRIFYVAETVLLPGDSETPIPTARPTPEAQATFENPFSQSSRSWSPELPAEFSNLAKTNNSPAIRIGYQRKTYKETKTFIFVIMLAAILIGILGGFTYLQIKEPAAALSELEPAAPSLPLQTAKTDADDSTAVVDALPKNSGKSAANSRKAHSLPKQDFFFYPAKQVDECWKKTQPHLLTLTIDGRFGKKQATGLIVDSRGWILTSYRAIKDAWQIEISTSAKTWADAMEREPLQDLVRGVVAIDPENDLAVLAINRRFVVSLAGVETAKQNLLVRGEYLLLCGPPSESNPYGKSEVRVESRGAVDELSSIAQSKAESLGLDKPGLTWFTISGAQAANPGMPFCKIDGTVVAIAVFNENDTCFALPVQNLPMLLNAANGDVQPLTSPINHSESGLPVSISPDSPSRNLMVDLNLKGEECELFQWLPTDRQQYQSLQEFSNSLYAVLEFINESDDKAGLELAKQELSRWEQKLSANLGHAVADDPTRLGKINQFAKTEIKKGNKTHVVFFGSVYLGGIENPELILKFEEMETFVNVPFNPEARPMLPGINWLFFVETAALARPVNYKIPGEGSVRTETATIRYAIGPIE